jgi:tetratricopeptide (TPR) repeat protein
MADIFAIQDEITAAIVNRLKVEFAGTPDAPLVKRHTDDVQAYNFFLKGRYYLYKLSPEGWAKSLRCFEQALERDPSFAPVYAALCHYYGSQAVWGDLPPSTAFPRSKAAARKALELDETLADAHGCLAVTFFLHDWDDESAEREFARTFELDPDSALDRINYALFLMTRKRFEEARGEAKIAVELDPLSSMVRTWAAMVPCYEGKPQESRDQLLQVVDLDPDYWQPYHHMAFTYLFESNWEAAVGYAGRAVELSAESPAALERLAVSYYRAGRTAEGDEILDRLRERENRGWVAPSSFFLLHLSRGDEDEAFRCIERAVAERDPWLGFYGINPRHLRSDDPRFDRLIESTGLPV